jgi:hypothetical protein
LRVQTSGAGSIATIVALNVPFLVRGRDLGVDTEEMVYRRDPVKWKYPYAFDVPLDTWYELIVANAFYDRAGYCLLGDGYASMSNLSGRTEAVTLAARPAHTLILAHVVKLPAPAPTHQIHTAR